MTGARASLPMLLRLVRVPLAARARPAGGAADEPDRLMARHARTFDLAARFLPAERRRDVVALYAFCRTLDDLVDHPPAGVAPGAVAAELRAWRAWLLDGRPLPGPREPLASDLAAVIERYDIPISYLLELVEGLAQDLEPRELADAAELRRYCYQVAGTVGLTMAYVLGTTSPEALAAAEELGIAMQLTNILRDIGEDLFCGRVYLPKIELVKFGVSRAQLASLHQAGSGLDEPARELMRFQIARARAHYQRGIAGIWLLPPDCRLPILLAARLYRRILDEIERRDYDTLSRRAVASRWTKTKETAVTIALHRLWAVGEPAARQEQERVDVLVR